MTTVHVRLADGDGTPAVGALLWSPSARHVDGAQVRLPVVSIAAPLVAGEATVEVPPTGPGWCWQVAELVIGGVHRYVVVPDEVGALEYAALVDVDPATLDPASVAESAWWAALAPIAAVVGSSIDGGTPADPGMFAIDGGQAA